MKPHILELIPQLLHADQGGVDWNGKNFFALTLGDLAQVLKENEFKILLTSCTAVYLISSSDLFCSGLLSFELVPPILAFYM